jgi:hypothetical protein
MGYVAFEPYISLEMSAWQLSQLRLYLQELRDNETPFEEAWDLAVTRYGHGLERALRHTRDVWQRAYNRHPANYIDRAAAVIAADAV